MPPIAHSEPASMVSHSEPSRARFRSRSSPAMMRSMTSTPRTEPMRQGVHLPQDSSAQKAIAWRAIFAMSTLSSKATMPPWPTIAPMAAYCS